MDNFVDFIANKVVMNITTIREAAGKYQGKCTWHFSQCKDPVRSIIGKSGPTKYGICELLSAKWVVEESKNNTLMSYLTGSVGPAGGSGNRVNIDVGKISLLAQTLGTGSGSGKDQELYTDKWMRTNGLTMKKTDMGGVATKGASKVEPTDLINDLKKRYTSLSKPIFALLTVAEQNKFLGYKGHIMAVRIDADKTISYFDPNYGDFHFLNVTGFESWYKYYFKASHYEKFMGTFYKIRYF